MATVDEMGNAFPLDWPAGYPRTRNPQRAIFKATVAKARDQVLKELRLMGILESNVIISSNAPVSARTMQLLAIKSEPGDPGVVVYFRRKGIAQVIACDKWDRLADNLRAIALTLEAMRGLDRWGCSEVLERAFQGFTALPPPQTHWWEILGVDQSEPLESIEKVYRTKMKSAHPDMGGIPELAQRLNSAIIEARRAKGMQS